MTRLNQIIAIEKDTKRKHEQTWTHLYHLIQASGQFDGLVRTYAPRDENGAHRAPESKKVVARVPEVITQLQTSLERLFDLTATKDAANQHAVADISIGDTVLAASVPVTTLLWLEKKLGELRLTVSKFPVLSVEKDWTWDEANSFYRSATAKTTSTAKVEKYDVIVQATDKHPAQVVKNTVDVIVGDWSTQELSGAVPTGTRDAILARIDLLLVAVKQAREEANSIEVTDKLIGNSLLNFVFGG